uniref:Uncharacterized protein n=1 Tax=Odontella aurita TaxID=265563 RepID=A0A7S4J4Y9_9STRA
MLQMHTPSVSGNYFDVDAESRHLCAYLQPAASSLPPHGGRWAGWRSAISYYDLVRRLCLTPSHYPYSVGGHPSPRVDGKASTMPAPSSKALLLGRPLLLLAVTLACGCGASE